MDHYLHAQIAFVPIWVRDGLAPLIFQDGAAFSDLSVMSDPLDLAGALQEGREQLRSVPAPADAENRAEALVRRYDRFPERDKTPAAAAVVPPAECQTLRKICVQCHVFTGKLEGTERSGLHCDLVSCRAPLVDTSDIPGLAHVITGKLEGAVYAIAVPSLWNHRLFMYLHGTRPLGAPTVAELNLHNDMSKWLLEDGWMLAATSYKAHGLALTEALQDTVALRQHIADLFEEPAMVLLEGHSMGGLAASLLVERHPEMFSAAIGVGAAFVNARLDIPQNRRARTVGYGNESRAAGALEPITHRPRAPLLLLVNESEMSPAVLYGKRAWELHDAGDEDVIVPAVWVIKRPGHASANAAERLSAALHAVSWAVHGSFGSCRGRPAVGDDIFWHEPPNVVPTHGPSPPPVKCWVSHGAHGEIMSIRYTGGFVVSITRAAMDSIGVRLHRRFLLTIGTGPDAPPFHVFVARLTEYPYKGVEDYGWKGEFEPEHEWLTMSIKTNEYCNGAKALGINVGMPVKVELEKLRARRGNPEALARLRVGGMSSKSAGKGGGRKGKGKRHSAGDLKGPGKGREIG